MQQQRRKSSNEQNTHSEQTEGGAIDRERRQWLTQLGGGAALTLALSASPSAPSPVAAMSHSPDEEVVHFHVQEDPDETTDTLEQTHAPVFAPSAQRAAPAAALATAVLATEDAPANHAPQPSVSPAVDELDYGGAGTGFVPRASLERHPSQLASLGLPRKSSVSQKRGEGVALSAIEMTEQKAPETAKTTGGEEAKEAGGEAGGEGGASPPDAIWTLTVPEVAAKFPDSNINAANGRQSGGLSSAKAAEILARDGRNELKPPKEHSEIVKFLLQFADPFNVLLVIAGILSAAVAYPLDTSNTLNLYLGTIALR